MKSIARCTALFLVLHSSVQAADADAAPPEEGAQALGDIVVTARRREERLQDVPDAVTAFTAETIRNAGIQQLSDFAAMTPNLNFRDGSAYAAGYYNLSMRGIGQGQQGWPSVAFIVDGVPADSAEALTSMSLQDVEQIEVLRGPQSALYGSGAIAGAINVTSRSPTNTPEFQGRVAYGNGSDKQIDGSLSGALVPDKVLAGVTVNYRDYDGLIESASNGIPLDFRDHKQAQARLLFRPTENFEADLRATYIKDHFGSTYQDNLPSEDLINDFNPAYDARRLTPGTDDRTFKRASARLQLDLPSASIISVTSAGRSSSNGFVSLCYDDPDNPLQPRQPDGSILCSSGPVFGTAALPGQAIDNIFASLDRFESYSEDLRLVSKTDSAVQWLVGASGMHRKTINGFDILNLIAPDRSSALIFPSYARKKDEWWGVYGQVSVKAREKWEFTVAARYDDQQYESTSYTDSSLTTVAPVFATDGTLIDTQKEKADSFQPKGQISYHIDRDRMAYVTVSRGFRAGYFNTGAFAAPEKTTNYEVGYKAAWLQNRISANLAAFHIDYSNQQTSNTIGEPPYRFPVTIPETSIDGVETEASAVLTDKLTLSGGVAWLDAKVDDGTRSPSAPRISGSVALQLQQPLAADWRLNARADVTFHSSQYLYIGNTEQIPSNQFLNLRVGVEKGAYGVYAYGRNVTEERETMIFGAHNVPGGYYQRYQNVPDAIYGIELRVKL